MRRYALALLLALCLLPLYAELSWPQPIAVRVFDNVEYSGTSLLTADGCHLLTWEETTGGVLQRYFQLYSQQYAPIWPQNLPLTLRFGILALAETSDSCFVAVYPDNGLKAVKISREGNLPWGAEGVMLCPETGHAGVSLQADLAGGVYVAWAGTSDHERSATIQHLFSDGSASMAAGGISLDSGQDAYTTALLIRPDNSVLVAWTQEYEVRVNQVNNSGQLLWSQTLGISSPDRYPGVGFCAFDDLSFALSVVHYNNLHLHRFGPSGTALWSSPVCAISQSSLNSNSLKLKLASDNSILVMVDSWSGLYLQKVSAEGLAQYAVPIHFEEWLGYLDGHSDIVAIDGGACIVVACSAPVYPQPKDVQAVKIDTAGSVTLYPVTATDHHEEWPTANRVGNSIHIVWQRWETEHCGIYAQILDEQLEPTLAANGMALREGSSGVLEGVQISAVQNGCGVSWKQATTHNARWQFYLQYYTSSGQPLYGSQGLRINRSGSRLSGTNRILSNGSDLLLIWGEELDGAFSTRMQMVDQSGNLLMGEGGTEISSSSQGAGYVFATSYLGDWYLLWVSGGNVMGQKIRGTQNLWGSGLQLTQPHPLYGGDISSCWLSMPWLFWNVDGHRLCKRIDTQGATLPGFPDYGKVITIPFVDGYVPVNSPILTPCGDYIHILLGLISSGNPDPDVVYFHSMIGPDAELLFDPVQIAIYGDIQVYSKNYEMWVNGRDGYGNYRLRKFDNLGSLLLDQTVPLSGFPGYWYMSWERMLSNGDHLLLVQNYYQGSMSLRHFFITENWTQMIPADALLSSGLGTYPPALASQGDRNWVCWYTGKDSNQNYHVGIRLQRIIRDSLPNPEEGSPAPASPRFTGCSPNPFNPSINISFSLPTTGRARLAVYDLRGRKIRVLADDELTAAEHSVVWDGKTTEGKTAPSGVYILKLECEAGSNSRKITLLK
ncbi:MAG: T9SS type A sorting domain-containing protein [Candidatus Syntrophosphaera sp.]